MTQCDAMRQLLELILADKSAYWWHTAITNTLALPKTPNGKQA